MISLHKILIGFWILAGLLALVAGVKILHVPESRERILEQIREIAEELKIKEEDCMCILYVSFVALGFVGVTLALLRRIRTYFRERRNK
jgi:hypothetical protein